MRILVAEDDDGTADHLVKGLSESGHVVDRAADGETALMMALEGIYEAVVLDRRLPGLDGLAVVRRLRRRDPHTPVLMLSGLAATTDRVDGLRAGCDDYLVKPFSFSELLARIEALGRRADRSRGQAVLRVGDLEIDTQARTVSRSGRAIALQRREFLLLERLARHAGEIVTRAQLIEAVWNYDFEPHGNIVESHIYRLRRKLEAGPAGPLIETVPGAGYTIRKPEKGAP